MQGSRRKASSMVVVQELCNRYRSMLAFLMNEGPYLVYSDTMS